MPQLRSAMEQYLHRWQDDLSAAWREGIDGAAPNFDAIPQDHPDASLHQNAQIVPCRRDWHGPLYALEGNDPSDVCVVVLGNDPYPDPLRATGRSFEQGDLDRWTEGLSKPGRVTPSLLNLVCAAAALRPNAAGLGLADPNLCGRREKLRGVLRDAVALPPPRSMFEILTGQGVLWLNRTPTTSAFNTGVRDGVWREDPKQRRWHRALWAPVTNAIFSCLVGAGRTRPVVFALFGREAKDLRPRIENQRQRLDVPLENVRFVEGGHPCRPAFFSAGNPLGRVNNELVSCGREPIDWCGPTAWRNVEDTSTSPSPRARASRRSVAIMDRTLGEYRTTLKRLAAL